MTSVRNSLITIGLLALLLPAPAVMAEGAEGSNANVLITVRMGTFDGGERKTVKSYDLIVADGSPGSSLLSGERVPFPTSKGSMADTLADEGDGPAFAYRNIGFSSEIRAWIVGESSIKVAAQIEDSRVAEGKPGEPPTVETRQLSVNAILTDGKPLELAHVQGVTDHSGFVEIEAKILR